MVSVHHAETHTMTQWLKSQFIHVKQLLNPLCKLLIEVFIQHYITVITLLTYSSSRSLTLPFPFLGQSLTVLPWPDNPPTGGGLHSNSHVWMHFRLCVALLGTAAEIAQHGRDRKRHGPGWAELGQHEHSWAISAPVRQQQTGGMGSITHMLRHKHSRKRIVRVDTVRNMLRIVSNIVCVAVEDV